MQNPLLLEQALKLEHTPHFPAVFTDYRLHTPWSLWSVAYTFQSRWCPCRQSPLRPRRAW